MSYKTILVCLTDDKKAPGVLSVAVNVARRFNAHLIGVFALNVAPIYPSMGMAVDAGLYADMQQRQEEIANKCLEIFTHATKNEDFAAEWRTLNSQAISGTQDLIANALCADLVIIGQASADRTFAQMDDLRRDLISGSGRPVLVVPDHGTFDTVGSKILFGWNATREAANALHGALPFMQGADETIVFTIAQPEDKRTKDNFAGHELAEKLSRHGIKSRISHQPQEAVTVGNRMLNEAAEQGADLIVMGAFGHSRMHAFIFGAATRQMLEEMTMPILFSS